MVITSRRCGGKWKNEYNNKLGGKMKIGLCLSGGGVKGAAHIWGYKSIRRRKYKD